MKNNKLNYSKKNEKKNNSKATSNKTVVTKNAKYVLIEENNRLENIKNAFTKIKTSISKKSSNLLKNINLPNCLLKYKPQVINGLCLSLSSVLVLTGATLFNSLSADENLSTYYSAKSYTVYLNNEEVGIVRARETVDNTLSKIQTEYKDKYHTDANILSDIEIVESNANDSELVSDTGLYSKLKSKVDIKSIAYGVSVNGEMIGALKTKEEADELVNEVKSYFTQNYKKEELVDVSFDETVSVDAVNLSFNEISEKDELLDYIIIGTDEKVSYTVENGDTYWDIATKYDMTVNELMAANPDADENKLMPGDELSLVVPKPFINVNVKRSLVSEEKIKYDSETQYVSYMYSDESKVKKAGVYGVAEVGYVVTEQNGIEIAREEVSRNIKSQPQSEVVLVGTQTPPPKSGTGVFINPLPASTISSRYGQRGKAFHYGLDMAKASGSDIKAADGGTVIYSGWYGTYGYMIEIDHGGGWTTRYAHSSKLYVSKGEKVYQGQVIAAVGNTGYSTGPHLHFEVRKYGSTKNPASFIGQQYK